MLPLLVSFAQRPDGQDVEAIRPLRDDIGERVRKLGCLPRRRIGLSLRFASWFSFGIFYLASVVNFLFMVAKRDIPVDAVWPLIVAPLVLVLLAVTAVLANRLGT